MNRGAIGLGSVVESLVDWLMFFGAAALAIIIVVLTGILNIK